MKTIKLSAPKNWNELSKKQLMWVMRMFKRMFDKDKFLLFALINFTGLKLRKKNVFINCTFYYRFRKGRKKVLLSAEEVAFMFKKLSWLLAESTLTINPLPVIKIFYKRYYGPSNNLYNITLREFIFAETNFLSFTQSKQISFLNNMIAILWRPQIKPYKPNSVEFKGDRREIFNDHIFPKRAKKMRWLRMYKKFALFNFYSGSRETLRKENPRVFGADGGSVKVKNMANQMMSLIRAVNSGDPTKNEALLDINVRDILGEIETAHERVEQIKKRK